MEKIGFLWLSEVLLAVAFGRLLDDAIDLFSSILTNRPVSQLDVTYGFLGILAVIAITALTLILALYYLNLLKREQKETSLAVYTRDEIRLRDFLNKAKSSIHITGITLEETLRSNRGTMKEILQKSEIKEVRILMCNPESELVKMGQIDDLVGENTLDAIKSSLKTISDLKAELGKEQIQKLHIKIYDLIPTQSIFIIKDNNSDDVMRVEPYLFGIRKDERRIHQISKKNEKPLFETYSKSFEEMWKKGLEI